MPYSPFPDTALLSLAGVRYEIRYQDVFARPDDPWLDGPHIHNCYEVYFNLTGDVSFLAENRVYRVRNGDIVITRLSEIPRCIYHQPCRHAHFCLWFEAPEETGLDFFLRGEDFCRLYRMTMRKTEPQQPAVPEEMQRILDYINLNFREIQHIREIYGRFFIRASTLNRWFREYVRLTPREYLESKKLSAAQRYLLHGCSVTQACMRSGFSDCSHFISVFQKRFGEPPYRYQNSRRPLSR